MAPPHPYQAGIDYLAEAGGCHSPKRSFLITKNHRPYSAINLRAYCVNTGETLLPDSFFRYAQARHSSFEKLEANGKPRTLIGARKKYIVYLLMIDARYIDNQVPCHKTFIPHGNHSCDAQAAEKYIDPLLHCFSVRLHSHLLSGVSHAVSKSPLDHSEPVRENM